MNIVKVAGCGIYVYSGLFVGYSNDQVVSIDLNQSKFYAVM